MAVKKYRYDPDREILLKITRKGRIIRIPLYEEEPLLKALSREENKIRKALRHW